MNDITNETAIRISLGFHAVIFIAFIRSHKGSSVRFEYSAQTFYIHKDHTYRFHLKKINGYYRCYIIGVTQFPGKKPKYYMQGYATDPRNDHSTSSGIDFQRTPD